MDLLTVAPTPSCCSTARMGDLASFRDTRGLDMVLYAGRAIRSVELVIDGFTVALDAMACSGEGRVRGPVPR